MEPGECSRTTEDEDFWAKLVPFDSRYSDVEIKSNEMVICSEISCSSLAKENWCKIMQSQDLISAIIRNISSSTILVDDVDLGKDDHAIIRCGSEIIPGPKKEGYLGYNFKVMSFEKDNILLKILLDVEHAKCSICLNLWHDVVTVAPCLHNFCNGCFSEWLTQSQKKDKKILCPQCRAVLHSVGRNHFLHNIEEAILQTASSLKRSDDELAILDGYAAVKSNLVINIKGQNQTRKRPWSPPSDESYSPPSDEGYFVEPSCPQCETEIGGFRCNQTTTHLQCHACGGMMPSRPNNAVTQHCSGCDRAFCGAYWKTLSFAPTGANTICSWETFRPICEHTISRIPDSTHQNNRYEKDITERCISQTGRILQDVIADWLVKFNNREIDRTRVPLNHAETITSETHLCNGCYDKLVDYLLYWFRISIPNYLLPPDAAQRENCWYGYACRTQHRSDEHARKRNHVCRPTRGNNLGL